MTTLYMTVGLPGSSKSTWAHNKIKEDPHIVVHSSDALREELLGDVNEQSKNADIFLELHKRIKRDLLDGKNVIMDCTNLSRKRRMAFLSELTNISCRKVCVFFAIPFEVCMERNKDRGRVVPNDVMWRMYKSINIPCKNEGFDEVVVHMENYYGYYGRGLSKIKELRSFNQDNSHHTLSLGSHCLKAYEILGSTHKHPDAVVFAALMHDVGKVKTKVWENRKHEPTMEAHYYNHENVSAYDSFFYTNYGKVLNTDEMLYAALLIELHMKPYVTYKESEKSVKTDKMLLGEDGWNDLMTLHECDTQAH